MASRRQTGLSGKTGNLHRSDLRDSEKCRAFEELVRLNPDWSHKDLVIEALAETLKEAKKAREHSLDIKTFTLLMYDKAKASR